MNWTVVVYFGPMFLVMVWWFISARKWFKGPKVNVQHMMLGREGNVIDGEGKSHDGDSSSDNVVRAADIKSAPAAGEISKTAEVH
jgi:hypothetical protein